MDYQLPVTRVGIYPKQLASNQIITANAFMFSQNVFICLCNGLGIFIGKGRKGALTGQSIQAIINKVCCLKLPVIVKIHYTHLLGVVPVSRKETHKTHSR